jgi:hypothetical protein
MASNSRYAVRDREGDLGYDEVDYEVDYEDDLGYFMDAEEADHDMEVEDVEQGGSGDEDEGSDEDPMKERIQRIQRASRQGLSLSMSSENGRTVSFLAIKSSVSSSRYSTTLKSC